MGKRLIYILLAISVMLVVLIVCCNQRAEREEAVSGNRMVVQATEAPTEAPIEEPEESVKPDGAVKSTEEPVTTEVPVEQTEELVEATEAPVVTAEPTKAPAATVAPTTAPVATIEPTKAPVATAVPTKAPVATAVPTVVPTKAPGTPAPAVKPTEAPTPAPTLEPTPEHYHSWDGGVVTTVATCGTDGVKTYSCACGEMKTEGIPKTHAHDYEWGIVYKEPTCAESGSAGGVCRLCGYSNVALVPKTDNHNYVVYHQYCKNAESIYKCSICGNTIWKVDNVVCFDNDADGYCDSCSYPIN